MDTSVADDSSEGEVKESMKVVRAAHRGLIIFSVIIFGTYSSPPPSIESYAELEQLLAELPSSSQVDIRSATRRSAGATKGPPYSIVRGELHVETRSYFSDARKVPIIEFPIIEFPQPKPTAVVPKSIPGFPTVGGRKSFIRVPTVVPKSFLEIAAEAVAEAIAERLSKAAKSNISTPPSPTAETHLLLCHKDRDGVVRDVDEAVTIYQTQMDRWSLEHVLAEYENGRFYGQMKQSMDDAIKNTPCHTFTPEQEFPDVDYLRCHTVHACEDEGAKIKTELSASCFSTEFLKPEYIENGHQARCEKIVAQLSSGEPPYSSILQIAWADLDAHPITKIIFGSKGRHIEQLPSRIRSSIHYSDIAHMRLDVAREHVLSQRREIVARWTHQNKTVMSIPLPSRSALSLILVGIIAYFITYIWVIIPRIRRSPTPIDVPWIGLIGRGLPTLVTAVVTFLVPLVAILSAIQHESLALELAGPPLATAPESSTLLSFLHGISPTQSLWGVATASLIASLSIVVLKLLSAKRA
jgi:hypothetical protein